MSERRLGIVLFWRGYGAGYLMWGTHGYFAWLPHRVLDVVVLAWNRTICFVKGHDRILECDPEDWEDDGTFHCTMCCASLTPVPKVSHE